MLKAVAAIVFVAGALPAWALEASAFTIDGSKRPNLRLGYCRHDEAELDRGIARLAASRPR